MRRADRLFQIVEYLRRRGTTVTAQQLASDLEVSERTIYRDVADLLASGVPIEAEAGVGYRLPRGSFDLPPLMFTSEEIEALVLGARVVKAFGDPALSRAADSVLGKVENVLPKALRAQINDSALYAINLRQEKAVGEMLGTLRSAIRDNIKVEFDYVDRNGQNTSRIVCPLGLFYWAPTWTLGAYCELRQGFRNFRLDRILEARLTGERFVPTAGRTLSDLFAYYRDVTSEDNAQPG
jgi:predicted DNA-binding transcriptional regulator YafY